MIATPEYSTRPPQRTFISLYTRHMRKTHVVLPLLLASLGLSAHAQTVNDNSPSWPRLERLLYKTDIHVKARHNSGNCAFKEATETELTCTSGKDTLHTYPRAEVKAVQIRHRGRSTLTGMAIGVGGGVVGGVSTCKSGDIIGKGGCSVIFGIPLGLIGAVVGASTDFTHSTVYRAP